MQSAASFFWLFSARVKFLFIGEKKAFGNYSQMSLAVATNALCISLKIFKDEHSKLCPWCHFILLGSSQHNSQHLTTDINLAACSVMGGALTG